jgi:hypothetical protein
MYASLLSGRVPPSFRVRAQATATSMAGLVSMLTAATVLAASRAAPTYARQLVFTALAGELGTWCTPEGALHGKELH